MSRGMIRSIIGAVLEGAIKRVSGAGLAGESFTSREYFQHYGFTSRPVSGAEGVLVCEGNHWIMIASDDRRYRLAIGAGEVALYDDQGQVVHFKDGKQIHVYGCDKLTADVAVEAELTCPLVTVTAATKVVLDAPVVEVTGDLQVTGDIDCAGDVSDGERALSSDRAIYNGHKHAETGTTTGVPNSLM